MTQILMISNPFEPLKNLERLTVKPGKTPRQWLRKKFGPDFKEFQQPTVLQWNGELIMRADWKTRKMKEGDVLAFVAIPQAIGVIALVVAIIAIAVAVVMYLTMPNPRIPNDKTEGADAVYTLRGQTNKFRPGEPIEVLYGQVRHWPSYACRPYSEYIGNEQFQFSLFCLGQGEFDISAMQLNDTPVGYFPEVAIEVIPPGGTPTLVESAVYTCLEVQGIDLQAPDEPGFTGPSGPYVVNEWESPVHRLSVDVSFPQGLYKIDDEGKLQSSNVALIFEYCQIDQNGNPLPGQTWLPLVYTVVTRCDNTPQRITFSCNVSPGRYMVRGLRASHKSNNTQEINSVKWEAAKAYAQSVKSFGNVTLIAMRALATNSINDQSAKSFNCVLTRKLPTWNPASGWGSNVATRNPIWAMCDIFTSIYGAKLPPEYLDMPTLYNLAQTFETRGDWFDWVFDSGLSIWEAAKMPLAICHALPIPQGSLITAVRDEPATLPAGVFNQHNIVKGSLKKTLSMFEFQPFDGITIEYTDPTNWQPKTVDCILPGRAGLNLDRLKLPGCTDSNRAYREGMYLQARREQQRKNVTFQTGLEGYIPSYLDLISITHDTLRVGQGGIIIAYDSGSKEMTLSEQVIFAADTIQHKIAIRGDDGAILGTPINVTAGSEPNKVILETDPAGDLDFSDNRVSPLFAFGVADVWAFMGKVTAIRPVDEGTVEITAVNYAPGVYNWGQATTIPATGPDVIRNPTSPTIPRVSIVPVPNDATRVFVDWVPVPGATAYAVQIAYDHDNWNNIGNFAVGPVTVNVNPGRVIARVAPIILNGNVIFTESIPFVVGSNIRLAQAPETIDPQPPFTGLTATARWQPVNAAIAYTVDIYAAGVLLRTLNVGTAQRVDYTFDQYTSDGGTGRQIEFQIAAINAGGTGARLIVDQTNPPPSSGPTGLLVGSPTGTSYPASWNYTPEGDEKEFRVYASIMNGFAPNSSNRVTTTTGQTATIPAPTRPLYWRVGVVDKWGTEETVSAQAVIS